MSKGTERTRARRQRRRAEIVEHAARLAEERGGPTFTTEELAEAADVSQGSLFYYFRGGRQEIDTALALRESWLLFRRVQQAVERAPDGVAGLRALVEETERALQEDEDRIFGFLEGMLKGPWPAELIDEHVQVLNDLHGAIAARLAEDRARGALSDDVVELRRYSMLVISLALGQLVQWKMIRASGGASIHARSALFADLADLLERGTRKPR